ncbi:LysR family transcriptional regulator [Affinibrenneria salicis]|nr:LysR family transcriptional regulator [Affinibrenneria salicis]
MKTFLTVVECHGFRAAADQLRLSPAMISRRIDRLEAHLGLKLINRTTRALALTQAGQRFYQHSTNIVRYLEQSVRDLNGLSEEVSGVLKVGLPYSLSHLFLAPAVHRLSQQYPELTLEIVNGNHLLDIFSHSYDLALHAGPLPDSGLYYQLLGFWRKKVCASPDYFAIHGKPETPEQLVRHNCLDHYDNRRNGWGFWRDGERYDVQVKGNLRMNSSLDLCKVAEQGAGVVYLPSFTVKNAIAQQRLVSVLDQDIPGPLQLYVVHANRNLSAKEQAFIQFLHSLNLVDEKNN